MPRGATYIAPDRAPTFFDTDHHESERIEPWASEPPRCERLILFLTLAGIGYRAPPKRLRPGAIRSTRNGFNPALSVKSRVQVVGVYRGGTIPLGSPDLLCR